MSWFVVSCEGIAVDLTHEQFIYLFQATGWASSITGAMGAVASGPFAIALGIIGTVVKLYGAAITKLEKGNGMRFHIPWFAIYPAPSPLYVVPMPL